MVPANNMNAPKPSFWSGMWNVCKGAAIYVTPYILLGTSPLSLVPSIIKHVVIGKGAVKVLTGLKEIATVAIVKGVNFVKSCRRSKRNTDRPGENEKKATQEMIERTTKMTDNVYYVLTSLTYAINHYMLGQHQLTNLSKNQPTSFLECLDPLRCLDYFYKDEFQIPLSILGTLQTVYELRDFYLLSQSEKPSRGPVPLFGISRHIIGLNNAFLSAALDYEKNGDWSSSGLLLKGAIGSAHVGGYYGSVWQILKNLGTTLYNLYDPPRLEVKPNPKAQPSQFSQSSSSSSSSSSSNNHTALQPREHKKSDLESKVFDLFFSRPLPYAPHPKAQNQGYSTRALTVFTPSFSHNRSNTSNKDALSSQELKTKVEIFPSASTEKPYANTEKQVAFVKTQLQKIDELNEYSQLKPKIIDAALKELLNFLPEGAKIELGNGSERRLVWSWQNSTFRLKYEVPHGNQDEFSGRKLQKLLDAMRAVYLWSVGEKVKEELLGSLPWRVTKKLGYILGERPQYTL